MDKLPDNNKDPTTPPPVPLARKRRTQKSADSKTTAEHEITTSTSTVFVKTVKSTTKEIHEENYNEESSTSPVGQSLREKVAKYEKVWSSGGAQEMEKETENPFEIDVFEIEKRLREERKRGLAEAEAAKLAFQQIQLRATESPPKRVEIHETHAASPFNVTLKTTTKMFTDSVSGTTEECLTTNSPFNVTLRTNTKRQHKTSNNAEHVGSPFNVTLRATSTPRDDKLASAQFLANEKTVREVKSVDGVRTIVTSSMTSDGSSHEEKIFRHGEGYFSPQREGSQPRSLSSISSGRSSATPPRSIDMTAGGRRILIRLEDEQFLTADEIDSCMHEYETKTADLGVDSGVAMGTYGNIDITVGSSSNKHQHINEIPWRNLKTGKTTTTISKQQRIKETKETNEFEKSSIIVTRQLLGSPAVESRHIATPTRPFTTTSKVQFSGATSDITDDSDTEGISASELVIVPINYDKQQSPKNFNSSGGSALNKSPQSANSSNEYKEFQSSMAARSFARSNSQYDSHIKELRGKYFLTFFFKLPV